MAAEFGHVASGFVDRDAKRTLIGPVGQVVAAVDAHLLSHSQDEVPLLNLWVPETLRVAEVFLSADEHGVAGIFLKGHTVVLGYSHRLYLAPFACRGVEGDHPVVLLIYYA